MGEFYMLINNILDKANQRHLKHNFSETCENCSYKQNCPHDCELCLRNIHFRDNGDR